MEVVSELKDYNCTVDVYDPWVSVTEAKHEYGITLITQPELAKYDGIILAVGHSQFKSMGIEAIRALGKQNHILYDLKYLFLAGETDLRL